MPKTITAGMTTHLGQEVTTLATLWRIIRTDGQQFFFTDHDADIVFDGNTYESAFGYDRTAVANQVGLSVDNLDVSGFLDSSALTELELRAGLFDYAEVRVSVVNWANLVDGEVKLRRGRFGEVIYSDSGVFKTELRGLTQAYSQQIVELLTPECRADLGDTRCKIPLEPPIVLRNTAYAEGDFVKTSSLLDGVVVPTILLPLDTDGNDIGPNLFTGTFTGGAGITTSQSKFGGGSANFNGAALQGLDFSDNAAFTIGANDFTVDCWIRGDTIPASPESSIASHYSNGGSQRAWYIQITSGQMIFFASDDGSSVFPAVAFRPSTTFSAGTWYHIAVTRDSNKIIRMYVDGVQINGSRIDTISVGSSTTFTRTSGSWLDDGFRDGQTIVTSGFTNAANNGAFTVSGAPTATVLTVTSATLVTETGDGDEIVEQTFTPNIFDSNQALRLGRTDSTTDILFDGQIDDFRFVNGGAAWTGSSFTPPTQAHTVGITQALLDSLTIFDFDDRIYECIVSGTTQSIQPSYDTVVGNDTIDGTATFRAVEAWTRSATVATVTDNRNFSITVDETRAVDDWFKHGAAIFFSGSNIGRAMEIKHSEADATTGTTTLSVTAPSSFTRPAGDFTANGFEIGMKIITSGFSNAANNGTFTIATVAAGTITIEESTLVTETGDADELMIAPDGIELFLSMPFTVQVGDQLTVHAGCDKRLTTCINKFDNVINFRGEPYVPGPDSYLSIKTKTGTVGSSGGKF